MLKSKKTSRNKIIIFSILALILIIGIYFSFIQSVFDNDADKHFSFDVGEDVVDGYTLVGTNLIQSCGDGTCINVNGTSDYVDANYSLDEEEFTVSSWVYRPTATEGTIYNQFYFTSAGSNGFCGTYLFIHGDGRVEFVTYWESTTHSTSTTNSSNVILPNQWYNLVVTYNNASNHDIIYLNGKKVAEHTSANYINCYDTKVAIAKVIPEYANTHGDVDEFDGYIDEFSMYDRTLDATEILSNYEEQKTFFINYNLEIEHSKEINVVVSIAELCSSVSLNDLYNRTTCRVTVDDNATILWSSETKTVTNPVEDLTIFMDEDKSITLTDEDVSSGSGGSGGSVPDVVEEIIEPEVIEEIIEQSLISDSFDFFKEYWEYFAGGILLIGIGIGFFLSNKN